MALGNALIDYGGTQTRAVVRVIQSGAVNASWAALFTVTYNGTEYNLGDSFTVNIGDTITIHMNRKYTYAFNQIYVNDSVVVNQGNSVVSYDYIVQKSTDVTYQQSQSGTYTYLKAYIADSDVVAGFERKITEGRVLIDSDGTPTKLVVEVAGMTAASGYSSYFYVEYNGTKYYVGDSFTVPAGDNITVSIGVPGAGYTFSIYDSGELVKSNSGSNLTYTYTIQKSTLVEYKKVSASSYPQTVYITNTTSVAPPVYIIKRGKWLKDNVAYDIGSVPISVVITGDISATYGYCMIDSAIYSTATTGIEVASGDIITLYVYSRGGGHIASITIDGSTIWSGQAQNYTYDWTVPDGVKNITVALGYYAGGSYAGTIIVTTT